MTEIVDFPGRTCLDLPVERILNKALNKDLDEVVVIGYTKEGEFYFASSKANGHEVLWLLQGAEYKLIKIGFDNGS